MEARKWGHTEALRLVVCEFARVSGGGRKLPRSRNTGWRLFEMSGACSSIPREKNKSLYGA